ESAIKMFKPFCRELTYGDSPGGIQPSINGLKKCGFYKIAENQGIFPDDFDHGEKVSCPEGVTSKQLCIANSVLSSDGLISLSKLKAHGLTRMTGAVKNQYGCIPGIVKGEYHARFPDIIDFAQLLVDINMFIKPRLFIMDAVYAMEGNGPRSGTPKKMGLLLLSTDPVALDTIACKLINLDPSFVPTNTCGSQTGLGIMDESRIKLLGDNIDQFIDRKFDVVRAKPSRLPKSKIAMQVRRFFLPGPTADSKKCTQCKRCVQACPVNPKAITFLPGHKRPHYDYTKCIRCFCCQEMCPSKAIRIKDPLLKKIFPFFSYISLLITNMNSMKNKPKN
ncbi:MAG: DUF362 domain-containing protein, partial [Fibrobacter sp.]|nr:DUF362 domain-containing protein [Fibrobacter sp.]